jgi:hypothetical protein
MIDSYHSLDLSIGRKLNSEITSKENSNYSKILQE